MMLTVNSKSPLIVPAIMRPSICEISSRAKQLVSLHVNENYKPNSGVEESYRNQTHAGVPPLFEESVARREHCQQQTYPIYLFYPYVYLYIYTHIHTHIHTESTSLYEYVHAHTHTHVHVHLRAYMHTVHPCADGPHEGTTKVLMPVAECQSSMLSGDWAPPCTVGWPAPSRAPARNPRISNPRAENPKGQNSKGRPVRQGQARHRGSGNWRVFWHRDSP